MISGVVERRRQMDLHGPRTGNVAGGSTWLRMEPRPVDHRTGACSGQPWLDWPALSSNRLLGREGVQYGTEEE